MGRKMLMMTQIVLVLCLLNEYLVVDNKILKALTKTEISKMQNANKITIDWGSRGKLV